MPYDAERHGPRRIVGPGFHQQVYETVARIPRGKVATYGDIAGALGSRSVARQVGFALAALLPEAELGARPARGPAKESGTKPRTKPKQPIPWQRVVNAKGQISQRVDGRPSERQRAALQQEGITVDARGQVQDFASRRVKTL